ncbi:helix-turn-helix domain-containing protein [Hyphobacterium marinum]|uniref:Helix-turn-helix domain-containing protein n=1 Tax=Hyphobacterium marinum TaxID=3116574 RepID=A0ABU7LUW2_9PROT|nr:helix-turn-helix domain-containing protein [Hyphobacterium sp. Y6023]MEE2565329.1 helix-turn-helix domain-containing protein [Hyphobacterium sp. Y6023]
MTSATALRHHRFETPFGGWRVSVMDAPPDLEPAVAEFWDTSGRFAFAREQLLPRGSLFLVFNLGTRQLRHGGRDERERLPRAYIWGLQDGPVWTAPDTAQPGFDGASVGARLHAGGTAALFGIPGSSFRGRVVALEDILPRATVERCLDRLSRLADPAGRIQCVAAFLRRLGMLRADPEIDWAVAMIRQSRGGLPIGQIADAAGLSRRVLTRRFRERIGTAPKRYARVVKFFAAIEAIKPESVVDWAGLAVDAGYFDQPHMIRDFREFSGLTPADFLKERAADGETIVDPG